MRGSCTACPPLKIAGGVRAASVCSKQHLLESARRVRTVYSGFRVNRMPKDIFENDEDDYTPGALSKSRPGEGPGERIYEKVIDLQSGRRVSKKPANTPFLAYQRFKQKEAEKEARIAAGKPLPGDIPQPSTVWSWLRPLLLVLIFLPMLGQFLTGSKAFGLEPQIRRAWRTYGPQTQLRDFTPVQLANFDGSDPSKPIYLAIDGDVYDVSSSARIYGPDGSYHMMAGRDAARAFTTGCFETHLTHDLRGLSAQELEAVESWKSFFANHERYRKIGRVLNPRIDPASPLPVPCRGQDAPGRSTAGDQPVPVHGAGARREL